MHHNFESLKQYLHDILSKSPTVYFSRMCKSYQEALGVNFDIDFMLYEDEYFKKHWPTYEEDFDKAAKTFKTDRNTRRAIINFWREFEMPPCFVSCQFLVRDNILELFVFQRSMDAEKFLEQDISFFSRLVEMMGKATHTTKFCMHFYVGSLHREVIQ
jgi:thymidylate synthase